MNNIEMNNEIQVKRIETAAKITRLLSNYNKSDVNYIVKKVYENRELLQKLHFSGM
jgi:hypothetical protein